jgi:DNA (cytosine-5)-methyltransferase 1
MFGDYWEKNEVPYKLRKFQLHEKRWEKYDWDSVLTRPWTTVREVVNKYPCPTLKNNIPNHEYKKGARVYKGHSGSPMDEPSKTLKAGIHGVPGGENMLINDDGSVRYFTIRECAALQSFPDDFLFNGSWSESVKQVGNAVPLELSYILALSIKKSLIKSLSIKC